MSLQNEKDPSGKDASEPGAKLDSGKIRPSLVFGGFSSALTEVARVGTIGAAKYSDYGWKSVEGGYERYQDAMLRHWLYLQDGEIFDEGEGGTGCYHLAQVAWNALAALELYLNAEEKDERKESEGSTKVCQYCIHELLPEGTKEDIQAHKESIHPV